MIRNVYSIHIESSNGNPKMKINMKKIINIKVGALSDGGRMTYGGALEYIQYHNTPLRLPTRGESMIILETRTNSKSNSRTHGGHPRQLKILHGVYVVKMSFVCSNAY